MSKTGGKAAWMLFGAIMIATTGIYWAGLRGGFVYDDFSFVVGNDGIKVVSGTLREWVIAAMAFPTGAHQGRWLGMLSFGLNHYLSGMDPWWFKASNLAIHLLNGLLVFLALRALFDFHQATRSGTRPAYDSGMMAAALAGLWLVLPINLTAVLYISQRLESLSSTFVFLGLWFYLRARAQGRSYCAAASATAFYLRARAQGWLGPTRTARLWLILIASTFLGVLTKESAILLPLYAALAEFALTGFRQHDGRWNRPILSLYGSLLLVPLVIGLVWLSGWVDGTRSFGRAFDIPQRLMTEARILFQYMQWTLLPNLDALTLYHDDIPVSTRMLAPPATLLSLLGIVSLLGLTLYLRGRKPLLALGVLWYFGGHVLTATVIPLMLAFEHRNYFPSIGLLLALASLMAMESWRMRARTLALTFMALFSFYAFTTAMRTVEWSDPLRLALSEAAKRPNSPSAQYALAIALLNLGSLNSSAHLSGKEAISTLEKARTLPNAGIMFEQLLITIHAKSGLPIEPDWWVAIVHKLKSRPTSASDVRALQQLNACFIEGSCRTELNSLYQAYAAAFLHGKPRAELLSTHAEFAWRLLGDLRTAERDARAAVSTSPKDIELRRRFLILLLQTDRLSQARDEILELRKLNRFGLFDELIDDMETLLRRKQ